MIITYNPQSEEKGFWLIPSEEKEQVSFHDLKINSDIFSGKANTNYTLALNDSVYIFIGLGDKLTYKSIKTAFRRFAHQNKAIKTNDLKIDLSRLDDHLHVEAAISGLMLGTYDLGHFKVDKKKHAFLNQDFTIELNIDNTFQSTVEKALKIAKNQLDTFDCVDLPAHVVTPIHLAEKAKSLEKNVKISVKVFDRQEAEKIGLHSFLAVAKGSENEPQFITITYRNPLAKKHMGLVGKAITFDTGGYNIKTQGMVHMKCDMAGGATALGAMQLIADLDLNINVTAIIPACENRIDGKAFLPSDVINSYSGKTIEIIDTDAEGRLVLADGISYLLKHHKPDVMIDVATLTGSAVATFGDVCAASFTNNEELASQVKNIGESIGEKSWPLPLWDEYKSQMDSDIADIKNLATKPTAGAITAAKFLEFFVENHPAWMHLDIAGVSFVDDEFAKTKHASAWGVHLLAKLAESI